MLDLRFVRSYSLGEDPGLLEWDMLGGVYTGVEIPGVTGDIPHALTGVWLVDASPRNMRLGRVGTILVDGKSLAWRAPGSSTAGAYQAVPPDYLGDEHSHLRLEDGEDPDKVVRVIVRHDILPAVSGQPYPITLRPTLNGIFDDITAIEAEEGIFDYRCLFLRNIGTTPMATAQIWMENNVLPTTVSNVEGYPTTGPLTVYVASTVNFPPQGVIRNETRDHNLVYSSKTDTSFFVPSYSGGGGMVGDVISFYTSVDVGTEGYPASTIPADDQSPLGVNLFHPTEAEPLDLEVDTEEQVATIWLRRTVDAGSPQASGLHFDLVVGAG